MKKLTFLLALMAFGLGLVAQDDYRLSKSAVKMSGTSTLHDWTADVTKVNGNSQLIFTKGTLTGVKALNVTMTVNSIKSSKGETMDNNMMKTLKAKDYPTISYTLTKVTSITQQAGTYTLETEGKLTIAGTTKTINMTVTGKVNSNDVNFKGTKKLKMSDFKVEAPVLFLGTLKTDDNVTITFDVTFSASSLTKK